MFGHLIRLNIDTVYFSLAGIVAMYKVAIKLYLNSLCHNCQYFHCLPC